MPSFSTHYIFAYEILPQMKSIADFEVNDDAVFFGAQGPDIFFFHRVFPFMPGRPLRKYGSMIHRAKPSVLLENMREYCKTSDKPDIAQSYVYGFILHYSLDKICHPYVYSYQNQITDKHRWTNPHNAHNIIEFSMDSYLLNKRMNIAKPEKFNTAETVSSNNAVISEIAELLNYVVPKTIHKNITVSQGITALRDLKTVQKICYDPKGIKRIAVTPLEIIAAPFSHNFKFTAMMRPKDLEKAKKYANIENSVWKSPYINTGSNKSFEELFELSKADAIKLITAFQAGEDCEIITENKSFLTGVEVI